MTGADPTLSNESPLPGEAREPGRGDVDLVQEARRLGFRLPRYRTGDPAADARLLDLIAAADSDQEDLDLIFEILVSGVRLIADDTDRLDLKITNSALKEMRQAFHTFAPYRDTPKVTIFGSARTKPHDPLYRHTAEVARQLADQGWMVVTGAGPGIMEAGMEGAGRERSIGVNIRLPFEQSANAVITGDPKLVTMKYFFTRKLMLMKESLGFVALPGGFGTLDETLELLTLQQTGKAAPAPVVLLDWPGHGYWDGWRRFVEEHLAAHGFVNPEDLDLALITDDANEAVAYIAGFYRSYHSLRFVGDRLVLRLKVAPTEAQVADLQERFGDLAVDGRIAATGPLRPEVEDGDVLDLARITLRLDPFKAARLHGLILALNAL